MGHHILIIDDVPEVARSIARILRFAGHTSVMAHDGAEALSLLAGGEQFDAAIIDYSLTPRMTGAQLALHLGTMDPHLPVLFMTGWSSDRMDDVAEPVIFKPCGARELLAALNNLLATHRNGG